MAAGEEKTEEPTAKKKSDARKKGNIPKSRDMTAALELLGAIYTLRYLGPYMAKYATNFFVKIIEEDMPTLAIPERKEIIPYALDWFLWLGSMLVPFLLLACLVAYITNYLQVGFIVSTERLKLDFNKLNPVAGLKRMFAVRNLVMLVMNLAKFAVVMTVAWVTIYGEIQNVITMLDMETAGTFLYTMDRVLALAERLAYILLALGLVDYYYQKWKHNKELKMTKQEIKEEFKQMEGDPMVKQKRRQKQMEAAMKRMMGEVPQAEVVVRNPTHYAVALSYNFETMAPPVVVAKGMDLVAERIIEVARAAGVPLVEDPPLARKLYKICKIGDAIPLELYQTVAKILSEVINLEKKRKVMEKSKRELTANVA